MKNKTIKSLLFGSALMLGAMVSCGKSDGPDDGTGSGASGSDNQPREYITLTAAYPDAETQTAGNGGTVAYALTLDEASDATQELDIYTNGYGLRSQRTARVQGSVNGNFLYNIQYTGTNGGVFNKYRVTGGANFEDTNEELNLASMLSTSPRWVKAAEGVGVGVKIEGAEASIDPEKAEAGEQVYEYVRGTVDIAIIDLDDPRVPNSTEFEFPFTDEEKDAGYSVGRIDVPVINGDKLYIGCRLSKVDPTKDPEQTTNRQGELVWSWPDDSENIRGTVTLVVDYPSLANPKVIWSTQSKASNNSYRTMTQYAGSDGNVYQATATSGSQILRINGNTADYDNSYNFDLKTVLGTQNDVQIKAWRYIADGIGLVLYTESNVDGGYVALIDLNAVTVRKLTTDNESDTDFSTTFGQYQNIGVAGDYAYVPLTASGKDGHLYIVNWRTGDVTKGIQLKGDVGSHFIGAY